jgi:hypothetical protein
VDAKRAAGKRNAQADKSSGLPTKYHNPVRGHHFVQTASDAHSRFVYSELLADERKDRTRLLVARQRLVHR